MALKYADASIHEVTEDIATWAAWIVLQHTLVGDVVGCACSRLVREWTRELRSAPQQQVAITNASDEFQGPAILGIARDSLLRTCQKLGAFFCRDMVGR